MNDRDAGFADAAAPTPPPPPPPPRDAGFARDAAPAPQPRDAEVSEVGVVDDAGFPAAAQRIYVNTMDRLFSFDPTTAALVEIGRFAPVAEAITDIAIDLDGYMYGGSISGGIYRINPMTAEVRLLFTTEIHPTGLTFLSDGSLVVAGERIAIVDRYTGVVLQSLTMAGGPETSGDIVGLPNGSLYASVVGLPPQMEDELMRLDPMSGLVMRIGGLGTAVMYGLGYADGKLWGFGGDGAVVQIDPANAAITPRSVFGNLAFFGATTNPVLW